MKKTFYFLELILAFAIIFVFSLQSGFAYEFGDEGSTNDADQIDQLSELDDGSELSDDYAGMNGEIDGGERTGGKWAFAGTRCCSASPMGTIKMQSESLDGNILKISVIAENLQKPALGLSFGLDYEGKNLAFLRYQPGDFLENGGDPFYLVTPNKTNSALIFGETLRQNDKFPLGGGKIVDFYFQILKKSELKFSFKNGVVSTLDTVRQDIDKIDWTDLVLDKDGKQLSIDVPTNENPENSAKIQPNSFSLMNFGFGFGSALVFTMLPIAIFWLISRPKRRSFKHTMEPVNFK